MTKLNKFLYSFLAVLLSIIPMTSVAKASQTGECGAYGGDCAGSLNTAGTTDNPFGTVNLPNSISSRYGTDPGSAIGKLIQYAIWILIIGAGIYALFNFILAGYAFMSAGDDPKKVAGAWAKIWQTALGVLVAAGAFVLAAIFGQLIFGDPTFILRPNITTLK